MTESMISRLERGDHIPSLKTLCRIADTFGRQWGWSKSETARAALQAGTGHVLSISTLAKQRPPNFAEPVLAGGIKWRITKLDAP